MWITGSIGTVDTKVQNFKQVMYNSIYGANQATICMQLPASSNKKVSPSNLAIGKVELKKRSKVRLMDGNVDARTYHLIPGPMKENGEIARWG